MVDHWHSWSNVLWRRVIVWVPVTLRPLLSPTYARLERLVAGWLRIKAEGTQTLGERRMDYASWALSDPMRDALVVAGGCDAAFKLVSADPAFHDQMKAVNEAMTPEQFGIQFLTIASFRVNVLDLQPPVRKTLKFEDQ